MNEKIARLRMRYLRKRKGFSLQDVADYIGRSVGFISQIERGISQPSIEDIDGIAKMLDVDYLSFFERPTAKPTNPFIVRPDERSSLDYRGRMRDELLSPNISGKFHMFATEIEPGAVSSPVEITEEGEQGGLLIEGEMNLWLNGQCHALKAGDSFQFDASTPHRYENPANCFTKLVWVVSLK